MSVCDKIFYLLCALPWAYAAGHYFSCAIEFHGWLWIFDKKRAD